MNGYRLLRRLNTWRWKHGILTGRWTAEEVAQHRARARQRRQELGLVCSSCGGEFDSPPCLRAPDGSSGHSIYGGVGTFDKGSSSASGDHER